MAVEAKGTQRKWVLLVEDNSDLREALAMVLAQVGHEVSSCEDGRGALTAASVDRPDFAIIDIDLPDMDGCDLARLFRADPRLHGIQLVALSGFTAEQDRRRALAAGFDVYLTKPVELSTLQRLLAD